MNFPALPDLRASLDPDGACLADSTTNLTNAAFLRRVHAAATMLRDNGVDAGDTVAIRLANRVEFVVLLFAAWRLQAAITPVNPVLTDDELGHQLSDSHAVVVITDRPLATQVRQIDVGDIPHSGGDHDAPPAGNPKSLALIIYTSGTTGKPKGVMLTHANIDAMAHQGHSALEVTSSDHCLLILPLFHVNGIVVSILVPLLAGAQTTIMERFELPKFLAAIQATRATIFSGVPTIFMMMDALDPTLTPDTSSVRLAITGAAPGPPELPGRIQARYGFPVIEGYGLSEATCASTLNTVSQHKADTVGRPLPGQQIRIVDDTGATLPAGANGEILIHGPTVMRGYLGKPELTAQTISDGWLHTGDLGHLDDDGFLVIVGRVKDMIIRGGENIYPKEIEDVLVTDDAVQEAAVVGGPDDKFGEIVIAYVVARDGHSISRKRLNTLCAQRLSPYKRPVDIRVTDQLPKNATGKVEKAKLASMAQSETAGP